MFQGRSATTDRSRTGTVGVEFPPLHVWVVMDDLTMTQVQLAKSKSGDSAMLYFN
jgi:hypothetical protein